ncbi:unnamed protein product [Prorocentrum cordatum]|uniref:Uncharacterized protein n=1 Tax=Prorocentrum cordatum TaxID=2364126 RepID=A0ABN9TXH8_9DINO|nr:unnamed protein product [Polarella glacialis]
MVNTGLAMMGSGSMDRFRQVCTTFFEARLRVFRGALPPPPASAEMRHRTAVLDLFLPIRGSSPLGHRQRRATLEDLLQGDWSISGEPQHYCPPGHCRGSADEIASNLAPILTTALFPCTLPLWPRHRWTGSDKAMDWAGLGLACHGILSEVLPVWVRCVQLKRDACVADFKRSHHDADLDDKGFMDSYEHDVGDNMGLVADDPNSWAQFQARCRINAKDFASADPSGTLVLCRRCMTPQIELMNSYFGQSGEEWAQQEQFKAVNQDMILTRVVACHRGEMTAGYETRVRDLLFNAEPWGVLLHRHRTEASRGLACRMLLRGAAYTKSLVIDVHEAFPFRLFSLLDSPTEEHAQAILDTPKSLRDTFTDQHLAQYNTPAALVSEDSLSRLGAVSVFATTDIGAIECRNGTIHRVTQVSRGSAGFDPDLETVSSNFMLMRVQVAGATRPEATGIRGAPSHARR